MSRPARRGRVYQRGSVWWIDYSVGGKRVRESSESTQERDARKLLRLRLGTVLVAKSDKVHANYTGDEMSKTQIFQHDEDVSVVTDAVDARDFIDTFADALDVLENGANRKAIAAAFDILKKLEGYKSNVHERRLLASGRWPHPSEVPVGEAGDTADDE